MKLRHLLPLLAIPALATTGLAQNAESAVQLRRDFTTVQQQRDALAAQVTQLNREAETTQAEIAALRAAQAAMSEKIAAADARAIEATEALRAQKEAEMTVDMTVRAYAIKEQEAIASAATASSAVEKLGVAERERESAVAEALRLTAERDAAKQAEAAALAAKAAMQNDLYAAQIRNENLSRVLASRSGLPASVLTPTPVVAEEPVAVSDNKSDTAKPAAVAPAGPRTHTVAEGESLSLIAFKYYQSPNKWDKIVAANRGKLKNPDMLRAGMVLVIP